MAGFQRIFQACVSLFSCDICCLATDADDQCLLLPSQIPSATEFPWELLTEKPGSNMILLTSMCFNPKAALKPGNAGPAQETLAVGGFTTADLPQRKKSSGTTSSCSTLKMQYIINKYMLKVIKLNSENRRS